MERLAQRRECRADRSQHGIDRSRILDRTRGMGEAADCLPEFVSVRDRVVEGRHQLLLYRWFLIDEVRGGVRRVAWWRPVTDLSCGGGRSDGALPELRHHDALGDFSRALRRLRLHPALL